jgi:hypothetical protein
MRRLVLAFGASAALVMLGVAMQAQPQEKKPETKSEAATESKPQAPATPAGTQEKKPEAPAAGQEKKPDAPAAPGAPQQDRLVFSGMLDTWYRIESIKPDKEVEHVGFCRERLIPQPAGAIARYQYGSETEIDQLLPDPKEQVREGVQPKLLAQFESSTIKEQETKLDDTYVPISLTRIDDRNGVQLSSTVSVEENIRKIRVYVQPPEFKEHKVSPDEEIYYSRFLMFIALRQNDNLSKPGARKAMLFHPREDGTTPVAEVQFQVGEMVKREYLGKKEVPVTPIIYIKPPPASTKDAELVEAYIDRYGRVLEETTRSGLRKVIVKDRESAIPKSLMVRGGGRRDPFDKRSALGGVGAPPAGEKLLVGDERITNENNLKKLDDAKKLLVDLKKAQEEGRDQEGDVAYNKIIALYLGFKKADPAQPPEIMVQVENFRTEAEKIWDGERKLIGKLRLIYTKSLDAFKRDQCEQIEAGITELKKHENSRILELRDALKQLTQWIAELVPKLAQCRTRIELAKKRVVLSGTTLAEEPIMVPVDVTVQVLGHQVGAVQYIRFIKPIRLAVINDKSYRIGDLVEGEGVRVEKIWAHGVQVSLKDETREVGIRQ